MLHFIHRNQSTFRKSGLTSAGTSTYVMFYPIPLIGLRKHAQHIRRLEYLELSGKGDALRMILFSSRIKHLRHLSIAFCEFDPVNMYGFELIRRNSASLMFLKVIRKPFEASLDVIPVQYCIPPDVLVGSTASKLTELALHNTSLTKEGLVHILRLSPSLQKIDLTTSSILTGGYIDMTSVNGTNNLYDMDLGSDYSCLFQEEGVEEVMVDEAVIKWKPFRHQGVIELAATLQEIFDPDPNELYLSELEADELVRSSVVRDEIKACCPNLSTVSFSASSSAAVEELVTNAFENLSEVHFEHHNYTVGVFHGLLHHHTTLHTIMTYADREISFDMRQLEPVADAFREHGRAVQLLFQILPLKTVCLYQHEIEIEWMEERPWRITLEELTVRIEG
ncbi:hypothetical protein BGX24_009119 [Mortierella sp. AD032]|nr:hypothetical protein BGX24_009119 [Mortierella sp. AD032]